MTPLDNIPATRTHHPSRAQGRPARRPATRQSIEIPHGPDSVELKLATGTVKLTHLNKVFWADTGATKGDLLRYYAAISAALLPHLKDRAMVMKRYPHGAAGEFFFMKRAPSPRPEWIKTCSIAHSSGNIIDFPMIQDPASLLWIVNLGCIDLNPWYARCGDVDRPDYLHFDLDPTPGASFAQVCQVGLLVKENLDRQGMPSLVKTTGSRGLHLYVPIVLGPTQKQVWSVAKRFAQAMAQSHPKLITAEYRLANRPRKRVLVDYNQNAWGRTLASVYSVRPKPRATVSMPVDWEEIERGITMEDFRLDNAPARIRERGDLWKPLLERRGRFHLEALL